jgi:hypothetical protein
MKSGDIMIIPPNVPHEFIFLEDTIDIAISLRLGGTMGSPERRPIYVRKNFVAYPIRRYWFSWQKLNSLRATIASKT